MLLLPLQLDLGLNPIQMRYSSLRQTSCSMESDLNSYIVSFMCLTSLFVILLFSVIRLTHIYSFSVIGIVFNSSLHCFLLVIVFVRALIFLFL